MASRKEGTGALPAAEVTGAEDRSGRHRVLSEALLDEGTAVGGVGQVRHPGFLGLGEQGMRSRIRPQALCLKFFFQPTCPLLPAASQPHAAPSRS